MRALVEHLPRLAPDWHFKLLRHPSAPRPLSNAPNVTEVEVNAEPNGPATMWWLSQLVDLSDVDLFHSPSNILPRGLTMPCVTTIHDVMWLTNPELCNPALWGQVERLFYRHGIKRALRQSNAILTVSEATKRAILEIHPELSDRTYSCLSGVSKWFSPETENQADLDWLGLPDRPYVLTVGQNAPYKNHEAALRGFAEAFAGTSECDLLFVQRQGPGSKALERLAISLGLSGRVHFAPPLKERELKALYRGAAALLHPSFIEGFGMPLAEAMACGCPVITSDRSAMPEVTGEAALLIDPSSTASIAAALKRVTAEPGLADEMRRKGLERAAELDWQAFAAGNLAVYRKVLGEA